MVFLSPAVTELIQGREKQGVESNYDYSKLKRKERKEKGISLFYNNTRGLCALAALLILRVLITEVKSEAIPRGLCSIPRACRTCT